MSSLEREISSHHFDDGSARAIIADNLEDMKSFRENLYHDSGVNVSFSAEDKEVKFGFLHYDNTSLDEINLDGALEAVNHLLGYHHLRNETTELKAGMKISDSYGTANIELYISSYESELDKIQAPDELYKHQMQAYVFSDSKVMAIRIISDQTHDKKRLENHYDIIENIIGYVQKNNLIGKEVGLGVHTKHNTERDPFDPMLYSKVMENKDKYLVLRSSSEKVA